MIAILFLALITFVAALPTQPVVSNFGASTQTSFNLCGNDDSVVLRGTLWAIANSMYGAAAMVGTQCTYFDRTQTPPVGNMEAVWRGTSNIQYVESTNNICKGYTNIAITTNLKTTISAINSIPATYQWTRTNRSNFKGNIVFDFILSAVKGDSTSASAPELMLWLQYEGGQLPIGWDSGAVATIGALFGTSWKLYTGINVGNGMTVHSLLPDKQFGGTFTGDLKDWFMALVRLGKFTDAHYVNVGNAGSELFYGNSALDATLGVQVNLN